MMVIFFATGVHCSESAEGQHSREDSVFLWPAWCRQNKHCSINCTCS